MYKSSHEEISSSLFHNDLIEIAWQSSPFSWMELFPKLFNPALGKVSTISFSWVFMADSQKYLYTKQFLFLFPIFLAMKSQIKCYFLKDIIQFIIGSPLLSLIRKHYVHCYYNNTFIWFIFALLFYNMHLFLWVMTVSFTPVNSMTVTQ